MRPVDGRVSFPLSDANFADPHGRRLLRAAASGLLRLFGLCRALPRFGGPAFGFDLLVEVRDEGAQALFVLAELVDVGLLRSDLALKGFERLLAHRLLAHELLPAFPLLPRDAVEILLLVLRSPGQTVNFLLTVVEKGERTRFFAGEIAQRRPFPNDFARIGAFEKALPGRLLEVQILCAGDGAHVLRSLRPSPVDVFAVVLKVLEAGAGLFFFGVEFPQLAVYAGNRLVGLLEGLGGFLALGFVGLERLLQGGETRLNLRLLRFGVGLLPGARGCGGFRHVDGARSREEDEGKRSEREHPKKRHGETPKEK